MEADLQVGEQDDVRARAWILLVGGGLVPRERLFQIVLPVGRRARPQPVEELLQLWRVDRRGGRNRREVTGELGADLGEHLEVAACHGVARALERIKQRVDRRDRSAKARAGLKEALPQQDAAERSERRQQACLPAQVLRGDEAHGCESTAS